jgi:hypothetical protein
MMDRPERHKYIDDGGPHPLRRHALRDPGEYRTEAEARAEFERCEAEHPGGYVLLKPPHGANLWRVMRKADVPVGGIPWT